MWEANLSHYGVREGCAFLCSGKENIFMQLRNGGPRRLQLQRFTEAAYDEGTKLSYHALIGSRKQSVLDVEQIFHVEGFSPL